MPVQINSICKVSKENIGLAWGVSYCVEISKEFELPNFIKSWSLPLKFKVTFPPKMLQTCLVWIT